MRMRSIVQMKDPQSLRAVKNGHHDAHEDEEREGRADLRHSDGAGA